MVVRPHQYENDGVKNPKPNMALPRRPIAFVDKGPQWKHRYSHDGHDSANLRTLTKTIDAESRGRFAIPAD